jgi:hypothetical protein
VLLEYIEAVKLTFQHQDFEDEEIESFQDLVDEGLHGVMNYIHLLGAGHLYECLK